MRAMKWLAPVLGLVVAAGLADLADPAPCNAEDDLAAIQAKVALLNAQTEETKAKLALAYAPYTATVGALGAPAALTQGGAVTAEDSRIPFMLWSKNEEVRLLDATAGQLCRSIHGQGTDVTGAGVAVLVPATFFKDRAAALAFMAQLDALTAAASAQKPVERLPLLTGAVGAVLAGGVVLEKAGELLSGVIKNLRTDRAMLESKDSKQELFQTLLYASADCDGVLEKRYPEAALEAETEAKVRQLVADVLKLRDAVERWNARKAGFEAAGAKNAAAQRGLEALQRQAGTVKALQAFIEQATAEKLAGVASALAVYDDLTGKRLLFTTLETQDLQIQSKKWSGSDLRVVGGVALQYRLLSLQGNVLGAGFIGKSSAEKKKNWETPQDVALGTGQ